MTHVQPDEARAREVLADAMASKYWAALVRDGDDDNWGVLKTREALAAMLAFRAEGVAAERDRAAGVCDRLFNACTWSDTEAFAYRDAAAAIRSTSADAKGEGK